MVPFEKMNGAGNDFIMIDVRSNHFRPTVNQIVQWCGRRDGIGADGLILLDYAPVDRPDCLFSMIYYNSDGSRAAMCGNGGRCVAYFALRLGLTDGRSIHFWADDGIHDAVVLTQTPDHKAQVRLSMNDVKAVHTCLDGWLLDTGVPHYVQPVDDIDTIDVAHEGRRLRFHPDMGADGANVDFVEMMADNSIRIRTYERGVEGETLACGTGVTAAAIVTDRRSVHARGGDFTVDYDLLPDGSYRHVWLTGPVAFDYADTLQ